MSGVDEPVSMARPLRVRLSGAVYHVTARGNERQPIYRDDQDRRRFIPAFRPVAQKRSKVAVRAACHSRLGGP